MLKKLISALLILLLVLSLMPAAMAEDEITVIDPAEAEEAAEEILLVEPNETTTVTVQPQDVEIVEGGTAVFHVEAAVDTDGVIGYRWQYRTPKGGSFKNCSSGSGMNTDTYSIQATMYRSGYLYRCMITVNGYDRIVSTEALLTVRSSPDRPVIEGPGWGESVEVNAELDGTAVMRVSATGKDLQYQWQYRPFSNSNDYETGWSNCSGAEAKTPALPVQAKLYRNHYMYRCKVYNDVTYTYSCYYVLTIGNLPAPPQITSGTAAQTANIYLGETYSLVVNATGKALKYQWYFRTGSEGAWTKCSGDGCTKAKYPIVAYRYRDGYQYRCKVYNDGGSVYSGIKTLSVLPQDVPTIVRQPHDARQMQGVYAYFFAEATGTNVKYQWQYKPLGSKYWNNCTGNSSTTEAKGVFADQIRDGYQYRCKIYNGAGAVYTDAVTLTVVESLPLTIVQQPQSVVSKSRVMLSVEAEGADNYIWYYRRAGNYSSPDSGWTKMYWADKRPALYVDPPYSFPDPVSYEYRCKLMQGDAVLYTEPATVTYGAPET